MWLSQPAAGERLYNCNALYRETVSLRSSKNSVNEKKYPHKIELGKKELGNKKYYTDYYVMLCMRTEREPKTTNAGNITNILP